MIDIKQWILNRLAKKLIPILQQSIKVLAIVEVKTKDILNTLKTIGVTIDGSVLNNINNVLTAVSIVKIAMTKILEFIGEPVEIQTSADILRADLDTEIEKLKKLF